MFDAPAADEDLDVVAVKQHFGSELGDEDDDADDIDDDYDDADEYDDDEDDSDIDDEDDIEEDDIDDEDDSDIDDSDEEDDEESSVGDLPHWTDPPKAREGAATEQDAWTSLTGSQPRWRESAADYDDEPAEPPAAAIEFDSEAAAEEFFEYDDSPDHLERFMDDEGPDEPAEVEPIPITKAPTAKAAARKAAAPGSRRPTPKGSPSSGPDGRAVGRPGAGRQTAGAGRSTVGAGRPSAGAGAARAGAARSGAQQSVRGGRRPAPKRNDMGARVLTGLALAALAIAALVIGATTTVALLAVVVGLSVIELCNALRRAGYQPAILLVLVASTAAPVVAYNRGVDGLLVIIALVSMFSLLWFLSKAGDESPVLNAGVSVFATVYVGLLGSYGALMLRVFGKYGIGMIVAAAIGTVGHDVGALLIGRAAGRTKLTDVSPKKTREGLLGGMIAAAAAVVIAVGMFKIAPFGEVPTDRIGWQGGMSRTLLLGVVIAVAAPLGDLVESLVKRDLGVKDMSNLLKGHGGVLDRFDAFLFTLPVTYYLGRLLILP